MTFGRNPFDDWRVAAPPSTSWKTGRLDKVAELETKWWTLLLVDGCVTGCVSFYFGETRAKNGVLSLSPPWRSN